MARVWASERQGLPSGIMDALGTIGGIGWHKWLSFPGQGRSRDGRTHARMLLTFKDLPHLRPGSWGELMLSQDLLSFEASPLALPPDIRQVATLERESGRGIATTPVQAPDGRLFNLNWSINFVSRLGLVGQDLRLHDLHFSSPRESFIEEEEHKITLVRADRDEDLLRFCPPMPEGLPAWMRMAWR